MKSRIADYESDLKNYVADHEQDQAAGRSSTAAHTPGPWEVDVPNFELVAHRVDGGPYEYICDCDPPMCRKSTQEIRANARLIAAAPDMLAALRIARLHAPSIRLAPERRHTIAVLDAAIAKAEGRS